MFSLMQVSVKLVPFVQVCWQHWTFETISVSSIRLISLVKPIEGSQPLLSKPLFKYFFSEECTASTPVSQFGFYLYVHFPQIYMERGNGGGQGLSMSSFYSVLIQHFSAANALRALCNLLCCGSHRKVNCEWERENHWPKRAEDRQSQPGYLHVLLMAVPVPPKACSFCSFLTAQTYTVLNNVRWDLSCLEQLSLG